MTEAAAEELVDHLDAVRRPQLILILLHEIVEITTGHALEVFRLQLSLLLHGLLNRRGVHWSCRLLINLRLGKLADLDVRGEALNYILIERLLHALELFLLVIGQMLGEHRRQ